ncbi:DinB family protein [Streptomyces albidoflavus]|uniref:DinB family protein n=1 Tax=Streptomyces TaxID=1883 RepID=UPI002095CAC4|nr:DinB family protein [Streptomyces sp. IpFD-1.1]
MTDADVLAVTGSVAGGERQVLETFLNYQRGVVRRKAAGLTEEQARRRHVPSSTTMAGLLKHLALVEDNWFVRVLGRQPSVLPDPEVSFAVGEEETVAGLIAAYEAACARSRESAAGYPLDHVVPHAWLGQVSLRWILTHMIEETARHAGHADILRELTDGTTGTVG